jgi:hypothetical protein
MQKMSDPSLDEVVCLKRRVQHLEEEMGRIKLKMAGKKWL